MTCKDCKYWFGPIGYGRGENWEKRKDSDGNSIGLCRFNPPVKKNSADNHRGVWPEVSEDRSCGKYEAKTSPEEYWRKKYYKMQSALWEESCCRAKETKAKRELGATIAEMAKLIPNLNPRSPRLKLAEQIIDHLKKISESEENHEPV